MQILLENQLQLRSKGDALVSEVDAQADHLIAAVVAGERDGGADDDFLKVGVRDGCRRHEYAESRTAVP